MINFFFVGVLIIVKINYLDVFRLGAKTYESKETYLEDVTYYNFIGLILDCGGDKSCDATKTQDQYEINVLIFKSFVKELIILILLACFSLYFYCVNKKI